MASPGWVRVRLPAEVLRRLSSGGGDFLFADPSGSPIPCFPWRGPSEPPPATRTAALTDVVTVPGGWKLEADLGAGTFRHRMLLIEVPGTGLAEGVTVEGSPDGQTWRLLARGSMFRLNRWGMTSKTSLEYAPTTDRFLRIFWPESAGFPTWKTLWVADWPEEKGEWVQEPLSFALAWNAGGEVAYRLEAPAVPVESATLLLELPLPYPVQARLLCAKDGAWEASAETILVPDRTALLSLPEGAFARPAVLALSAGGYETPKLKGATLRYAPRYVVFKAEQAGTYALWYGAMGREEGRGVLSQLPAPPEKTSEGLLGPERTRPLPDLPAASLAMGAPLPDVSFAKRWPIENSGAEAGSLVRMELPPAIYAIARPDLGDIRLSSGGKQVPYVLYAPPDGRQVTELRASAPVPSNEAGKSQITFELEDSLLPLVSLELTAPSAPFSRAVALQYQRPAEPGEGVRGDVWVVMDQGEWRCPGASDAPSRLTLHARTVSSRKFRLLFTDGDNAPLPSVDAVLWRRRHVLIFPWPADGQVELCAGAKELCAPSYDLASLKEDIIRRPAQPAGTGAPLLKKQVTGPVSWKESGAARWALLIGLIAAGGLLVYILARSIRPVGDGPQPPSAGDGGE